MSLENCIYNWIAEAREKLSDTANGPLAFCQTNALLINNLEKDKETIFFSFLE